jgi:enoyl-CoA hydratase/carnithine racemase
MGSDEIVLILGENISAEDALRWGLVEKVVEPEVLDDAVEEWVCQLEKNGRSAGCAEAESSNADVGECLLGGGDSGWCDDV